MGEKTMGESIFFVNESTGEKISVAEIQAFSHISYDEANGLTALNTKNFSAELMLSETEFESLRQLTEPLDNLVKEFNRIAIMYLDDMEKEGFKMNNVNHKMVGDGFKEVNEILKKLERFEWYCTRSSWKAGYIVLAGVISGDSYGEILEEDNDFGIIYLYREYISGDWESNSWELEVAVDDSLCREEVNLLSILMDALSNCKESFPSSEEETDSYNDRQVTEVIVNKEMACIRQSKGREKDSVKL